MKNSKDNLAYVIGVAIGDGNLSNPNGRAVRLRVSCDLKYKNIIISISRAIQKLLPNNKVSLVNHGKNCIDISCYSNKWEDLLGWKAKSGSKYKQKVSVPGWIKANKEYTNHCLRGLFETDGCVYKDRGYIMANFVTIIPNLANDVIEMIKNLGFAPRIYKITTKPIDRYTIRISKNAELFIKTIELIKN
jgi:intein/homing endonuclease